VIFKLLGPKYGLPSRYAKADQVTTTGRGYSIVVATRNFHNQSPFIFHKDRGLTTAKAYTSLPDAETGHAGAKGLREWSWG
jgi:hypothetical protein